MKTIRWILLSIITCCLLPAGVWAHGELDEQIAAVTKRIEKDPRNAALHLKRGQLHRMHREWDATMADLDQASMLDPDLSVTDLARGRTLLEANWPIFAKLTLDRVLAKQPTHSDGLVTRARVLVKLKQPVVSPKRVPHEWTRWQPSSHCRRRGDRTKQRWNWKRDCGQNFSTEVTIPPQRFRNLKSNHNNAGTESPMQSNSQIWQANRVA